MKPDKKTTITALKGIIEEREKHLVRANFDYFYALANFQEAGGEDGIKKAALEIKAHEDMIAEEEKKGEKKDKAKVLIAQAEVNRLTDRVAALNEVKKVIKERLEALDFKDEVDTKLIQFVQKIIDSNPMVIYEAFDNEKKNKVS